MKRLRDLTASDVNGGINAIDLGASGGVKAEWKPIAHLINVIGFDPNVDECARLNQLPSAYRSAKFLPYALAGKTERRTLHKTKSIYCWSLLRPRLEWLNRFSYSDDFQPTGSEEIQVFRLEDVAELEGIEIDAMKIDTQGLELPVLKAAGSCLDDSVWIETETGFTQNYEGETTFDQILQFMDGQGFGLFALDASHAVARKNRLSPASRNEQLLWCEAVWLRDYYRSSPEKQKKLTRAKALRALCLYANHGCIAFALEAAALFRDLGLFTGAEYDVMKDDESWWRLPGTTSVAGRVFRSMLDVIPRRYLKRIRTGWMSATGVFDDLRHTDHPLKRS